jgi:hypothetical protein
MGMNNASDYLTGDNMIAYLIDGMDGASEGTTYAHDDYSRDALVARNHEILSETNPVRGALIDSNAIYGNDARHLELAGLITVHYASRFLAYALTDDGAALAASLRA